MSKMQLHVSPKADKVLNQNNHHHGHHHPVSMLFHHLPQTAHHLSSHGASLLQAQLVMLRCSWRKIVCFRDEKTAKHIHELIFQFGSNIGGGHPACRPTNGRSLRRIFSPNSFLDLALSKASSKDKIRIFTLHNLSVWSHAVKIF